MSWELEFFILLFLSSGGLFLILYVFTQKSSDILSSLNAYDKIPNFGKYIIGLPNVDFQHSDVTVGITDDELLFVSNIGKLFGNIQISSIRNIYIDRKTNIGHRLTATRILTLGIFSLAAPKQTKEEEYCLVIEWEDDSNIVQNTIFEFSGVGCSSVANNAFNRLCKYVKPKPVSNQPDSFSSADEILKFSKLKDEGIISEDEFEKKKKELLENT